MSGVQTVRWWIDEFVRDAASGLRLMREERARLLRILGDIRQIEPGTPAAEIADADARPLFMTLGAIVTKVAQDFFADSHRPADAKFPARGPRNPPRYYVTADDGNDPAPSPYVRSNVGVVDLLVRSTEDVQGSFRNDSVFADLFALATEVSAEHMHLLGYMTLDEIGTMAGHEVSEFYSARGARTALFEMTGFLSAIPRLLVENRISLYRESSDSIPRHLSEAGSQHLAHTARNSVQVPLALSAVHKFHFADMQRAVGTLSHPQASGTKPYFLAGPDSAGEYTVRPTPDLQDALRTFRQTVESDIGVPFPYIGCMSRFRMPNLYRLWQGDDGGTASSGIEDLYAWLVDYHSIHRTWDPTVADRLTADSRSWMDELAGAVGKSGLGA